jgi:hypothetical protein
MKVYGVEIIGQKAGAFALVVAEDERAAERMARRAYKRATLEVSVTVMYGLVPDTDEPAFIYLYDWEDHL